MDSDRLTRKRTIFEDYFSWLQMNVEVNKGWTLLEFGTGKDGFAKFYGEHVTQSIALDVQDYSSFHPGLKFIVSDGKSIPLPKESVDLVASHSVLEHVDDPVRSVSEIARVLKHGGYAYLTVSPLYYSSTGSHVSHPELLHNWEHLDPGSKYHLLTNPISGKGTRLNQLTSAQMLEAVGHTALDIIRFEVRPEHKVAPDWVVSSGLPLVDIFSKEFRLLAHKRTRITPKGATQVAPHPYLFAAARRAIAHRRKAKNGKKPRSRGRSSGRVR